MEEIKGRIKQALQLREMKQTELAEKTGIDKGQISSYLSGRYKPKQENLSLMAAALEVSEYWLMGMDVSMERIDTEEKNRERRKRIEAYANQVFDMRDPERVLKLYEQLSEENRGKVKVYMERLLAVQRMEEEVELH